MVMVLPFYLPAYRFSVRFVNEFAGSERRVVSTGITATGIAVGGTAAGIAVIRGIAVRIGVIGGGLSPSE